MPVGCQKPGTGKRVDVLQPGAFIWPLNHDLKWGRKKEDVEGMKTEEGRDPTRAPTKCMVEGTDARGRL